MCVHYLVQNKACYAFLWAWLQEILWLFWLFIKATFFEANFPTFIHALHS